MRRVTPKAKSAEAGVDPCVFAQSYGRNHFPHKQDRRIICFQCRALMGCRNCVQIARELLCLNCHDWATQVAVDAHGHILNRTEADKAKVIFQREPGPVEIEKKIKRYADGTTDYARDYLTRIWKVQDKLGLKAYNNPPWYKP